MSCGAALHLPGSVCWRVGTFEGIGTGSPSVLVQEGYALLVRFFYILSCNPSLLIILVAMADVILYFTGEPVKKKKL